MVDQDNEPDEEIILNGKALSEASAAELMRALSDEFMRGDDAIDARVLAIVHAVAEQAWGAGDYDIARFISVCGQSEEPWCELS